LKRRGRGPRRGGGGGAGGPREDKRDACLYSCVRVRRAGEWRIAMGDMPHAKVLKIGC
jgi:hypothetical protein